MYKPFLLCKDISLYASQPFSDIERSSSSVIDATNIVIDAEHHKNVVSIKRSIKLTVVNHYSRKVDNGSVVFCRSLFSLVTESLRTLVGIILHSKMTTLSERS